MYYLYYVVFEIYYMYYFFHEILSSIFHNRHLKIFFYLSLMVKVDIISVFLVMVNEIEFFAVTFNWKSP